MDITVYRDKMLAEELRQLPAEAYNTAHTLLARQPEGCVFVPIRSMQYLAIIDAAEIVFVDSDHKDQVAIAWTDFHPQQRSSLQDAVPYSARYYRADGKAIMQRLQAEFLNALRALRDRQPASPGAKIIKLSSRPDKR